MPQNFIKACKASVVESLPPLGDTEIGEIYIETTNNRIYVRIVSGWKYASLT